MGYFWLAVGGLPTVTLAAAIYVQRRRRRSRLPVREPSLVIPQASETERAIRRFRRARDRWLELNDPDSR